jgi:hypothetical protein
MVKLWVAESLMLDGGLLKSLMNLEKKIRSAKLVSCWTIEEAELKLPQSTQVA